MINNHTITKSNSLIEARYKLTLEEQKLVLYMVSMVQPKDEDFSVYTISVKDFMALVDVKNKGVYGQFKEMADHLLRKPLYIKKENSTLMVNWLSSAEYYSGEGKIELSFDPKLKPYLLMLKANFTSYKLKNVITLKSFYSIRIYELLKQYERLKERIFTLTELREYLCIEDGLYPMYSNLKQKVINVAHAELKAKSDIYFEYEEIKQNRKVAKIKFTIYKRTDDVGDAKEVPADKQSSKSPEIKTDIETLKEIINLPLSDRELISIYEVAGGDLTLIEKRYEEAQSQRQLENFVGFMIWACKEPDESFQKKASRRKNKYNNFQSRERDYGEIERMQRQILMNDLDDQGERVQDESDILL